ncbi:MAG TPA: sporulation protein YqfD [Pseudogracilibacillus sp.]|nr:sporulation protein YqfD [Pseudogracilibacillus sp.]
MKRIQGKQIVGHVSLRIDGKHPEFFLQRCVQAKIPMWNIKKISNTTYIIHVYRGHRSRVQRLGEQLDYDVTVLKEMGLIALIKKLFQRRELFVATILAILFLFVLSNIVWDVKIQGVSTELEEKINEQLVSNNIYRGSFLFQIDTVNEIENNILNDIPELLYISLERRGTVYVAEAIEKTIVEKDSPLQNQHLIAAKNGVIQKMFIKKGIPVVQLNDVVRAGDILVSGTYEKNDENDEDTEKKERTIISADGEVYATTWYEIEVSSSLLLHEEKVSGEKQEKLHVKIDKLTVPLWGFHHKQYDESVKLYSEQPVYVFKWKLPFTLLYETVYNKDTLTHIRTIEEAREMAIEQAKKQLLHKLDQNAKIEKYYVLHETVESGKVKLYLYVTVLENIAKGKAITD